jgi:molybdate transport system substrate-binding protein
MEHSRFPSTATPELLRTPLSGSAVAIAGVLITALLNMSCTLRPASRSPARLTVSAAISLKEALQDIRQLYLNESRDTQITYNFGGSGMLEQQIAQGAPADIFISASPREVDALAIKGLLVENTRTDLAENEIVLVTPEGSPLQTFTDLAGAEVQKIALGQPESVPAGLYGKQVLTYFHLYDGLQRQLVFTKDVRQALTYVSTGNVDAALVYQTEASLARGIRVVAIAPQGSHEPILYPMAAVKTQRSPAAALRFMQFLTDQRSQAVFLKYGFIPVRRKPR